MNCPSCAAEIAADARYALLSVCPYCESAIVLDADVAKIAGKMSALAAPRGPLSVGARGSFLQHAFVVLGRVRYGYERGFWDEWYLQLDDGSTVWISEDGADFSLQTLDAKLNVAESFDELSPGQRIQLGDKTWHVNEIGIAECEGGQGQLPFVVSQGEKVPFADLSRGKKFASIEYDGEGETRVFLGRRINSQSIEIDASGGGGGSGLSDEGLSTSGRKRVVKQAGRSKNLRCESCGAPVDPSGLEGSKLSCGSCGKVVDLSLHRIDCPSCSELITYRSSDAASVDCQHCHARIDISAEQPTAFGALYLQDRPKTPIQIGAPFEFRGARYHVCGFIRSYMTDEGVRYYNNEWLLHSPKHGYRILESYAGHWSFVKKLSSGPSQALRVRQLKRKSRFRFGDQQYRVFETCHRSVIDWVEGELDWVAQVGDVSGYMDAISPPLMLSATWTETEMEWYLGEYVCPEEIAKGLGKPLTSLPRPKGIAPHQPIVESPRNRQMRMLTTAFAVLFLLVGFIQLSKSGTRIADFQVQPQEYAGEYLSPSFVVSKDAVTCSSEFQANSDNSWHYFDVALINDKDEALFDYSAEISYYHGYSGGESWSEGSRSDSQLFRIEKAGSYRLLLKGQYGDGPAQALHVQIYEDVGVARYFILIALALSLWFMFWLLRKFSMESRRWSDD
ncbi:MAG: hypothetical protein CSA62_09810 [Planctomycetota bacterium]|nr:MAG: hypothetical protein CSA62_09810 [Planctomycetota bacterium]